MRFIFVALIATLLPSFVSAQDLQVLLDQIASPNSMADDPVDVRAHVTALGGQELIVTIDPAEDIRLVADPGISITLLTSAGVRWLSDGPVLFQDPSIEYFKGNTIVTVPFEAMAGTIVEARVEYAYCIVGQQCLFGEASIEVSIEELAG
ncbi:MAG: hypothetical protein AAFY56_02075 [Pseudomonadota bacterium]